LGLDHLEEEMASVDLAQLDTQLASVRQSLVEAREHWDECIKHRTLTEAMYLKIAGTDDAAKAEAERQSALTNGQHQKLLIEQDSVPRLISKKADGTTVRLEGMSDGTSDQLFLALRLVTIEMQMEEGTPLPFIADDLLINCDDERTAASFAL